MPPLSAPGAVAGPLSSKLSPPQSQARQVLRQAVVRRMADAGGVKLLLVRAPAGFGKTTAMVQAREQLAASDRTEMNLEPVREAPNFPDEEKTVAVMPSSTDRKSVV